MTDFLAGYMDREAAGWFAIALLAALAVLALYVLFKAVGGARRRRLREQHARLSIVDVEEVDGRRRLVLIRRDAVEHLVMIGGPTDLVIETGIGASRTLPASDRTTPPDRSNVMQPAPTVPKPAVRATKEASPAPLRAASSPPQSSSNTTVKAVPEPPARPVPNTSGTVGSSDRDRGGVSEEVDSEIQQLLAQMGRDTKRPPSP